MGRGSYACSCLLAAFRGPDVRRRLLEIQAYLSQSTFPVQTSPISENSRPLWQNSGPMSLRFCRWLRSQSPRENWGQRDGSGELSEWAEPLGYVWVDDVPCRASPRAGSMVMSFGWPVVCVCVCAQQDVPVLWLSDHLFLAVGFCMSVYF